MKKITFILSLLLTITLTATAQSVKGYQQLVLQACSTSSWDGFRHNIGRTPPRECSLPEVYFDNASSTIAFVGGEGGSAFTYYILDAAGNILLTSPLSLASDEEVSVSLTTLSPATYTIVLYINGRYYEGEIEL